MKIEEEIRQTKFRNPYHKVTVNLLFTVGWLESNSKKYFKPFGLTQQQFNILRILRGQHPRKISVASTKSRMLDRNSDVSRLLSRLISKKLVIKAQCPDDKRAAEILITNTGLSLLAKIDKKINLLDGLVNALTADEANRLSDLLDKIRG
jgi:DNA-binding MarR family transcriptional regulator